MGWTGYPVLVNVAVDDGLRWTSPWTAAAPTQPAHELATRLREVLLRLAGNSYAPVGRSGCCAPGGERAAAGVGLACRMRAGSVGVVERFAQWVGRCRMRWR
ncbi:hypothetical protein GXW82_03570 [Streptacidiphilus sp. 4-A2]|nr:hypothetical protein [Streptacidiphilus sp. 4-A2]